MSITKFKLDNFLRESTVLYINIGNLFMNDNSSGFDTILVSTIYMLYHDKVKTQGYKFHHIVHNCLNEENGTDNLKLRTVDFQSALLEADDKTVTVQSALLEADDKTVTA